MILHTDRLKIQTLSYLTHLQWTTTTQNSIYHENYQDFLCPEMTSHHHNRTCTRTLITLYTCSLLIKVREFSCAAELYHYQKFPPCPKMIDYIIQVNSDNSSN
jgi:predicted RNA-binding Zn-ribbon protein involved in translation (DUF1610 family)